MIMLSNQSKLARVARLVDGRQKPWSPAASQAAARYLFSRADQPRYGWPSAGSCKLSLEPRACRRLTNQSAGSFAPSSFVDATSIRSAPSGSSQLSILDGSDHLPALPVPALEQTLELLKETIWPITMNSAEFARALELIEAFSGSPGQKLDLLLRAKASATKNWLTHDWWLQEAYLKSRAPLVINSNPAMIYPQLPYEVNSQRKLISTMAQLVSGVIDFKLALLQGYNPEAQSAQDEFRLNPNLCYNQYKHLFGSTRMPGDQMDQIHFRPLNDDPPNDAASTSNKFNLVFSLRGKFFEIQLHHIDNEQDRVETLQSIFTKVIDHSTSLSGSDLSSGAGLGVLTADRRDVWAQSIKLLDSESVRTIREAHLMVCLDTVSSKAQDKFLAPLLENRDANEREARLEALSRQVLHSDRSNVGNRWFDKSLQLILVADDQMENFLGAGVNYEHCVAEATVVTKLIEYSYAKTIQQKNHADQQLASGKQQQAGHSSTAARYRHLKLVDESRAADLTGFKANAERDFAARLDQFELAYFNYKQYGSNSIKSWRFSPDSWFQVGLQLAYYQLHKRLGPCYESASTRQFAYGRTETIRSLTNGVAEFCREPSYQTLKSAVGQHKAYANKANHGNAIDRVLFGYRLIFNELKNNKWTWGLPTFDDCQKSDGSDQGNQSERGAKRLRFNSLERTDPNQQIELTDLFSEKELKTLGAFFNNELIERSKKFALSTSQVPSVHPDICTSYGPLLADGYGCCYNLSGQQIVAAITANSSNQSFSCEVDKLSESLGDALDKMRNIVEMQQQRSKSNLN